MVSDLAHRAKNAPSKLVVRENPPIVGQTVESAIAETATNLVEVVVGALGSTRRHVPWPTVSAMVLLAVARFLAWCWVV